MSEESQHVIGPTIGTAPPETVIPSEPADALAALESALASTGDDERRRAIAGVVAGWPRFLAGWASLGDLARDPIEAYAYYRVGYHRGLDKLRQSGWRGSGYVRWSHPENHGFLRSLDGLRRAAGAIGEADEEQRCTEFMRQLDPQWRPDRA